MKCKICGKEYKRKTCEFCEREKKWKETRDKFRKEIFPPRLIQDLQSPNLIIPIFISRLVKMKREKQSIYIHGITGSGKTVFAGLLLEEWKKIYFLENQSLNTHFISVPLLLGNLRNTFSEKSESTEMDLITFYSQVDKLILDDLGMEKSSDWALQSLYIIINNRYENLKPTVFTSNFNLDQLAEKLGDDRIPSRIHSMCHIHQLKNEDRRLAE